MAGLDALAGMGGMGGGLAPTGPSASSGKPGAGAAPMEPSAPPEEAGDGTSPEDQDKMMLIEDFRMAPPEDALAAFSALLTAFGVKRS